MRNLQLKVPPVAVFLVALSLIHLSARWFSSLTLALPFPNVIMALCLCMAGFLGLAGIMEFRRYKTTVNPLAPDLTVTVVDSGVFALSRNPMYLALLLLLFGLAYWQQNALSLVISAGFVMYMNHYQIEPEERILHAKFGEVYLNYTQRVRRWL
ncbi:MAG: methyltransferase family protein [Vibrio sp.]|uniref:Isoprenylcysteine carboxylmethyltransferase family protein n=1 Tax=Vibrio chanodichtyis TaxID=3027932 RepID=A0ABT5V1W3_9VIBR|nr:isoprenylcysteine carboxylmethyltransferase family protein [Vibrio chanodichtyis]MDE1514320.1 isoprenylcysteine carboxylmethyltransferase family protein [Vibrio chanodichtyis]